MTGTIGRPTRIVVMAKAPVVGRSKTRLVPPLTYEQAARVAEAALLDTLEAVRGTRGIEAVLALHGEPGPWLPSGFRVIEQRGAGLAGRLAAAFADVGTPAVAVDADTPQIDAGVLGEAVAALEDPSVDAVLGPAEDGGYWAIGLRRPAPGVFERIPMSSPQTIAAQRHRLRALGLGWRELAVLRDVDVMADAVAVAAEIPGSRFARAVADALGVVPVGAGRPDGKGMR